LGGRGELRAAQKQTKKELSMRVTFHLCGDVDLELSSETPDRAIRATLSNPMDVLKRQVESARSVDDCGMGGCGAQPNMTISAQTARAIASALLGMASEVS
jgi:hypothetical protein